MQQTQSLKAGERTRAVEITEYKVRLLVERTFTVRAVDELNASWEAISRLPTIQKAQVRKINVAWGDGETTGWFDSDTANGPIDCSSLTTDEAKLLCAQLSGELQEIIDAIWDGRLEAQGAETFTDPARALIDKAAGTTL